MPPITKREEKCSHAHLSPMTSTRTNGRRAQRVTYLETQSSLSAPAAHPLLFQALHTRCECRAPSSAHPSAAMMPESAAVSETEATCSSPPGHPRRSTQQSTRRPESLLDELVHSLGANLTSSLTSSLHPGDVTDERNAWRRQSRPELLHKPALGGELLDAVGGCSL